MSIRNYITEDQIEKAAIEAFHTSDIKYRHIQLFKCRYHGARNRKRCRYKTLLWDMLKKLNPICPKMRYQTALDKLLTIDPSFFWLSAKPWNDERPTKRHRSKNTCVRWSHRVPICKGYRLGKSIWKWFSGRVAALDTRWCVLPSPDLILFINGLPLVFIELKNMAISI